MPQRDPRTGQFVSNDHHDHGFEDIEVATFEAEAGVRAQDLDGTTAFSGGQTFEWEGLEVVDYDDLVDRDEELVLLEARHRLSVFVNSTETADGTVAVAAEVSAAPSLSEPTSNLSQPTGTGGNDLDTTAPLGTSRTVDTIDILGRPLYAIGHAPFSDGASGVGGAGSAGEDTDGMGPLPHEFGRFHPRDEVFVNGRFTVWNIDDAAVHVGLSGQHVYGVSEGHFHRHS
jgi:hypothetical protein